VKGLFKTATTGLLAQAFAAQIEKSFAPKFMKKSRPSCGTAIPA
jgi:hypothetical protein